MGRRSGRASWRSWTRTGLVAASLAAWFSLVSPDWVAPAGATTDQEALHACHLDAYHRLKAPATAVWPVLGTPGVTVEIGPGSTILVRTFVDAQNSFGALIRTGITCTIYNGAVREIQFWRY